MYVCVYSVQFQSKSHHAFFLILIDSKIQMEMQGSWKSQNESVKEETNSMWFQEIL